MSYLSRKTLIALADAKLRDAELLLAHNWCSNAYYLSGYAVEFGLKACVSRLFMQECLPDKDLVVKAYTHDLKSLLGLSGLKRDFDAACGDHPQLATNWSIVSQWSEATRYVMVDEFVAVEMIRAVGQPDHGVLQWLKHHW